MTAGIGRRRFIGITAAASGLATLPFGAEAAREVPLTVWNGAALGARASIRLFHPDRAEAERLIARARSEIDRLERIFSLYRPDSALSRLNRAGALASPPLDLVALLSRARGFSEMTQGAFDVTVQPLWTLYAAHFTQGAPGAPSARDVAQARSHVDYRAIRVSPARIAFGRPGMAVTLNGIAQGYITDRVAALFTDAGLDRALLDLGEQRALGPRGDDAPWSVGIADPARPEALIARLDLAQGAVATSAPDGFRFDRAGRYHHLFDPRTGRPAAHHASVTVLAPDATTADALSTGFALMPMAAVDGLLAHRPDLSALLIDASGALSRRGAKA